MVVCDNCKTKLGNSEEWRGVPCNVCEGEFCYKCSNKSQGVCLEHVPTCKSCKTKALTEAASNLYDECFGCEASLCAKCIFEFDGMAYCAKCVPKCQECKATLEDSRPCDTCDEDFCETCIVEITGADEIWHLCKKHNAEFIAKNVDNNIIIDYVTKLLKEVKLSPIKTYRNLPLPDEDEECTATFETRKGFISVFFVEADHIRMVIEGRDAWAGSEITISAYNHKDAVTILQRKCAKLLRS